jgi:Protein of unknown function (DUF2971)
MPATVEPPVLPNRLYRYRALSPRNGDADCEKVLVREIAAIKKPYLWCSAFDCLNDPMEGVFRPSTRLATASNFENVKKKLYHKKTRFGIACFSDTRRNELMWTHYAGNYSGICIAYRTQDFVPGLPDGCRLIRLGYDDRPPRLPNTRDLERAAVIILSQKKSNWAYEREWRVLVMKSPAEESGTQINIKRLCVTHVYLGSRIDREHKQRLLHELHGTGIAISQMEVSDYRHTWSSLRRGRIGLNDKTDEYDRW